MEENRYKNLKLIIIDNYDSFTYNLVHIVEELIDGSIDVLRNDEVDIKNLSQYDGIILSPGPGIPDEAGLLKEVIKSMKGKKPILGVCLGLQAIGEVYGSEIKNLDKVYHGISTKIQKTEITSPIFAGIEDGFEAGRYHSWVIDKETLSAELNITAVDNSGEIMAIQDHDNQVYGVQFHPESIMTPDGMKMIENFLETIISAK